MGGDQGEGGQLDSIKKIDFQKLSPEYSLHDRPNKRTVSNQNTYKVFELITFITDDYVIFFLHLPSDPYSKEYGFETNLLPHTQLFWLYIDK